MDYFAFSLLMLLAQFSPGPDMLLLIRNALTHPVRAGIFTVVGIACGLAVHLTVVLMGVALTVRESRVLLPGLLLAGGGWLIWLGVRLLRSPLPQADDLRGGARVPLSDRGAFLQGLVTNLTNVKAVLFLATVVLAWLGPDAGWERRAAVPAIVLGQALVFWSLFVLALQHRSVRRFWGRAARPLTLLFAVGLMLLGGDAVFEGIRKAAAGWEWDRH